jgi:hypothetical protein
LARGGGRGRFCSRACLAIGKRIPFADRFWTKVHKTDGCWLWTGTKHDHGYGRIRHIDDEGRRHDLYAHRIAWEQASGRELADGEDVCHTCDIPNCVRNDEEGSYEVNGRSFVRYGHLFAAGAPVNFEDRDAKDRVRHGSRHPCAKLSESDIGRIFVLAHSGAISHRGIARAFKVSHSTIEDVLRRRTWKRADPKAVH